MRSQVTDVGLAQLSRRRWDFDLEAALDEEKETDKS